jgi:hypothetical protein
MPPCCFVSCSLLTAALLPAGDESAMNFEAVGGFLDIFHFPQHFLRVGSALRREHVAFPSIATEQAASGRSYGLGLRGAIILVGGIICFLCTTRDSPVLCIRTPLSIDRGCANFREFFF